MLFCMKSPALTRTSPRKRISSTSPASSLARSSVSILTTEPPLSLTTGGSIESTGMTTADFPGSSILSWTPVARNLLRVIMVAGWTPTAASPVFLALPYLSLNPPGAPGKEKTGRPTIISSMKPAVGFLDALGFLAPILFSQSHPTRPSLSHIPHNFWALPTTPSTTTMRAPPLSLFVSIPGTSLKLDTS